ncbi:MAG: hypothetical protein WED87_05840 [Dehalococcoidia bacterium]
MSDDSDFKFEIRFLADDEAVLHALRGLAYYAEQDQYKMKAVKGTQWSPNRQIVFRFTQPDFRDEFRLQANRLLTGRWAESD